MNVTLPPPAGARQNTCESCLFFERNHSIQRVEPTDMGCGHHSVSSYYILDVTKPPCRMKHYTPH